MASILDAEPDKLLVINENSSLIDRTEKFVSWRLKNKSNEAWPIPQASQVIANNSKDVAVSDKFFKLFVTLKEPADLDLQVSSFYCEPLGP